MDCKTELLQIRTAVADGKMTADEAKLKIEEIRNFKKAEEKKQAMENAPIPEEKRGINTMEKTADVIKNAQFNTRARIDISGTGRSKTLSELVKSAQTKSVLDYLKIIYGKDASTVVPAYSRYGSRLAPVSEGGAYSDTAGTLSKVDLVPYTFGGKFMLSKMAQELSAVDLEAEVNALAWDEIADAICYEVFQGTGSNGHFKGLCSKTVGAGSKTATTGATIAASDVRALAVKLMDKDYKNPVIFMNPVTYSTVVSSFGTTAADKVDAETLIRDKMIEGIPVVVTGYVPTSSTSGDLIVIGGDMSNYGIACAKEMSIEKKQVSGNAYDSFDFEAYLAGAPIIAADFEAITVK